MGPRHSGKAVLNPALARFSCWPPEVSCLLFKKDPLRALPSKEAVALGASQSSPRSASRTRRRAKVLLAVANGYSYTAAAQLAGRRTADAVAALVSLFNRQGLTAIEPRHAGGPAIVYDAAAKGRSLREFHRKPVGSTTALPPGR